LKAIFFFQGNSRQAIDDKADRFVVTSRSKNSEASARRKLAIVAACCLRFRRLVASAASSLPPPRRSTSKAMPQRLLSVVGFNQFDAVRQAPWWQEATDGFRPWIVNTPWIVLA